jgi:hypothetical protein
VPNFFTHYGLEVLWNQGSLLWIFAQTLDSFSVFRGSVESQHFGRRRRFGYPERRLGILTGETGPQET